MAKNTKTSEDAIKEPQKVTEAEKQTEEQTDQQPEPEKTAEIPGQDTKANKELDEFIAPYKKAYPKEKAFFITSDKQVFLEKDRGLAVLHQTGLNNGEKIQTVRVK